MGKSNLLQSKYLSKNKVALFTILAMMIGFLCARSIASIGMFLFGLNALRDIHPKKWLTQKWYLLGLLWVALFALSWFWSVDKGEWGAHFQVKLPYLFFPLAFGFLQPWTKEELRLYTIIIVGCMIAGACYSSSFFLRDSEALIAGYAFSHTLPTPAGNDHISFSTAVAATIAWCFYSWSLWRTRISKVLLIISVTLLVAYLHLLAAKTGLLALYVFLVSYFIYYFIAKSWKRGLLFGAIMFGCVIACYQCIPTFRTRINYVRYTGQLYKSGQRNGNYSDMGRLISYDIASKIIAKNPVKGVGCGDMLDEMGAGYRKWYPAVRQDQWLIPHNQFITVALAIGLPGAFIFAWWFFAPLSLVKRNREGFFFLAMWLLLLVPLFTDPFLEVQFGVFVYLFFLLMQRSLLLQEPPIETEQQKILP